MKKITLMVPIFILILIGVTYQNKSTVLAVYSKLYPAKWEKEFQLIEIPSSVDAKIQKAYYYPTKLSEPQPLLVSLHSWSGDYSQKLNALDNQAKDEDWNYIHPDFRGANNNLESCGSDLAVSDIDDAIDYAIANGNVDTNRIFVVGASGGGYDTLVSLMNLKHKVNTFQAWVPISNLSAWYDESKEKNSNYAEDILSCTGSKVNLNVEEAKKRSPLYMNQINNHQSNVMIFAGIHDGHTGAVPISHSLNFYNKLVSARGSSELITTSEISQMLDEKSPNNIDYGSMQGRKIIYKKQYENIQIAIFDGTHEMLEEYTIESLSK